MLFATLDPTMRRVQLPSSQDIILSDTVGFISDLPTNLVAAFRATLEEVAEADLILHVRDVSHPDTEAQRADVLAVLAEIGLAVETETSMIEVLNKIDLLPPSDRETVLSQAGHKPWVAAISAVTGQGMPDLLTMIAEAFAALRKAYVFAVPHETDGAVLAWLHDHGEVIGRENRNEAVVVEVRLDASNHSRFLRLYGAKVEKLTKTAAKKERKTVAAESP